jgi:hypothetical protein
MSARGLFGAVVLLVAVSVLAALLPSELAVKALESVLYVALTGAMLWVGAQTRSS